MERDVGKDRKFGNLSMSLEQDTVFIQDNKLNRVHDLTKELN